MREKLFNLENDLTGAGLPVMLTNFTERVTEWGEWKYDTSWIL
ncbi:hypothetical protein DSUL_20498 [Desulfovibrionales bacterium]